MEKEMDIGQIDKNLIIEDKIPEGTVFYNPKEKPFAIYGLYDPLHQPTYRRMPEDAARAVNIHIYNLSRRTAGGRIRFKTDSDYIVLRVYQSGDCKIMSHMAATGFRGFDMYEKENGKYFFMGAFIPPTKEGGGYVSRCDLTPTGKMRDLTLNFPLYNPVDTVEIGLAPGARVEAGDRYTYEKPIVFYGSSITQGGCASRPGTCHVASVARMLDSDHINLGFSGRAKGEIAMAEYIATLNPSVLVMDYDYNSAIEDLERTHWEFYSAFRRLQPEVPVLMASRPTREGKPPAVTLQRLEMLQRNFEKALAAGDKRVRFLACNELFQCCEGGATVDGVHPTDLGFYRMTQAFYPEVKALLEMTE